MNNQFVSNRTLRKRNRRAMETAEERESRLSKDRERKRKKIEEETEEQCAKRLEYQRKKSMQRRTMINDNYKISKMRLRPRTVKPQQENQELQQKNLEPQQRNREPQQTFPAAELNRNDRKLLEKFRKKMNKLRYVTCPVCKESCPSMILVNKKCQRCSRETKMPNKFSAENNMDPGEVPEELQGLTEIEEMLIARVFTVISVYRLRDRQYGYRGNVINFPQDIQEFATRLPRHSSSLEVLIVRRHSANSISRFYCSSGKNCSRITMVESQ